MRKKEGEKEEACVCMCVSGRVKMSSDRIVVTVLIMALADRSAARAVILRCVERASFSNVQPLSPAVISALLVRKAGENPPCIKHSPFYCREGRIRAPRPRAAGLKNSNS